MSHFQFQESTGREKIKLDYKIVFVGTRIPFLIIQTTNVLTLKIRFSFFDVCMFEHSFSTEKGCKITSLPLPRELVIPGIITGVSKK